MLRYNKFTAGAGWAYDYGTAEDNKEMFEYLYKYSPVPRHETTPATPPRWSPPPTTTTGWCPPTPSSLAPACRKCTKAPTPVLIRIETKAGHGAGRSTAQVISEQTDKWAFMFQNMGVAYTAAAN